MISTAHLCFYWRLKTITLLPPNNDVKRMGRNNKKKIKPHQKNTNPNKPHNSVQCRYVNYSKETKQLLMDIYTCRNKTSTDRNKVVGTLCEFRFPVQYGQSHLSSVHFTYLQNYYSHDSSSSRPTSLFCWSFECGSQNCLFLFSPPLTAWIEMF